MIIVTETLAACSAANRRSAVPGTPIMPAPESSSTASPLTMLKPVTGASSLRSANAAMRVPGASGFNVLRISTGRPWRIAGTMVCGCSTFAPK